MFKDDFSQTRIASGGARLIVISILVALLAGCAELPKPASTETQTPIRAAATVSAGARAKFLSVVSESDDVYKATELLLAKCMSDAGQTYLGQQQLVFDISKLGGYIPDLSVKQARGSGYQSTDQFYAAIKSSASDAPTTASAYGKALFGVDEEVNVTLGGDTTGAKVGGCTRQADRRIFGSSSRRLLSQDAMFNEGLRALTAVRSDPEGPVIAAQWQRCMATTAYPSFRAPFEAYSSDTAKGPDSAGLALADAKCRKSMGYQKQFDSLIDRYLSGFLSQFARPIQSVVAYEQAAEMNALQVLDGK